MTLRAIGRTQPGMGQGDPPKTPPERNDREKRLAEALRTNLRRRKAAPKPGAEAVRKPPERT